MHVHVDKQTLGQLLLRIGLAAVFAYAAISSLMQPDEWAGFLPTFLAQMKDVRILITGFAVYEIVLVLWLLSGKFVKYAAALAGLSLIGIIVAQPTDLIVTFRDIGLVCMAAALVVLN